MLTALSVRAERHDEAVGLLHALLGAIGYTSWEEPSEVGLSTVFQQSAMSESARIIVWTPAESHGDFWSSCSLYFRAASLRELEEAERAATAMYAAQVRDISRDREGVSRLEVFLPSFGHVILEHDPRAQRR